MRQSLAVRYRPTTFEDVVGQSLTSTILSKMVEQNNLKNCYLFSGPSGTGKTTCARVFANAVNKGLGFPIEVDAASNNGVDDVRAIIEAAKTRALDCEYKIFIIDECHAITNAGWQAFLLSLEETPPYTIYIFCTTEPNKIPEAVLNRMQRFSITKLTSTEIKDRLMDICLKEGFSNYAAACDLISKTSHGCMRDAIMKLEQCADYSTDLILANVNKVLNVSSYSAMLYLICALYAKDTASILYTIDKLYNSGVDLKNFVELFIEFTLDLAKFTIFNDISVTEIPEHLETDVRTVMVQVTDPAWYVDLVDTLLQIKLEIRYDSNFKSTIEAFLLRYCR